MFELKKLESSHVHSLLGINEDHFNDFKAKNSIEKIMKTASAFANADGGDLYVGIGDISESDRLNNLYADQEEANNCIQNVFSCFNDGQEYLSCEFLDLNGAGLSLRFTVQKTPFVVETPSGKIYKRQNAADREIKSISDRRLLDLEKGVRSHEDRPSEVLPIEVEESPILTDFLKHMVPSEDVEGFFRKERLIDLKTGALRYCGVLLFDENPQSVLPHSGVKIYRYKTLSDEGNRDDLQAQPETIEGSIYNIIYKSVERTKSVVESIPILSEKGLAEIKYPEEAIHEIICNAVLHRDYSINDYVHIRIFDNRIEVESPGKLPGPVTVTNILKQRFARNKKLVRLIAKFPKPPNKDVGEGLNTAFQTMQKLNLGKPIIENKSTSVMITLRHEPLASKEEIIKNYLENNGSINNTKAREICNLQSDSIIRKTFQRMIAAAELEKVPETRGKGTLYRLAQPLELE